MVDIFITDFKMKVKFLLATILGVFTVVGSNTAFSAQQREYSNSQELFNAVRKHDMDKVRQLIENGADILAKDTFGGTILHIAARFNFDDLRDIIEIARDNNINITQFVNMTDNNGKIALHYAKDRNVVWLLITEGANVFATDNKGQTVLHVAAQNTDLVVIGNVYLAIDELNADDRYNKINISELVNMKDNDGKTALHIALNPIKFGNRTSMDQHLFSRFVGEYTDDPQKYKMRIIEARKIQAKKDLDIAKTLLNLGADITITDSDGNTAFDYVEDFNTRYFLRGKYPWAFK